MPINLKDDEDVEVDDVELFDDNVVKLTRIVCRCLLGLTVFTFLFVLFMAGEPNSLRGAIATYLADKTSDAHKIGAAH